MWRRQARRIVTVFALVVPLAIGVASAASEGDRATAEAGLREVEASSQRAAAAELIARSRSALDRAVKLRATGDEAHARLAEQLAKTWADAAREVVHAAVIEGRAEAARRNATDAGVVAERERALLEEGVAQSGRLRAQLDSVVRESRERPARTSKAATAASNTPTTKGAPPSPTPQSKDGGM